MMFNTLKKIILIVTFIFSISVAHADVIEFAQVSDVHYTINNKEMDKYLFFLSLSLKKTNPDFVVFLGDNVDSSNEDDVIGFMRDIHSIKQPYYIVLGKSDAHSLHGLEKDIYLDIVSAFNRNQDNKSTYYYFKPNHDIVCVVMDDTSNFAKSTHGKIPDEQLEWLEKLLERYPKRLFIIFHHSPILPPRVEYTLTMLDTEKYESILKKHSNVLIISSGHYHQEALQQDDNGVRHISAPAFKDIPHSYQLIKIIYDNNSYKSPKDVEVVVTKIKV